MSSLTKLATVLVVAAALNCPVKLFAAQTHPPDFPTAAAARSWAEAEERSGNYQLASEGYSIEARMRRKQGDEQAAEVEELRASRLSTNLLLAIPVAGTTANVHLARLEPVQGCYIGVRDEAGRNSSSFVKRIGRPISIVYDYLAYGDPFPMEWARGQARAHRAIQIAWEPDNIYDVVDNSYLEGFASDAARCGTPVFIRFGGEMNGAWTPWGRNPQAYIAAFRLVHDVMARAAQNAAMVWAPNQVPLANLDRYYPGDAYVDWVGVSLYTVRYYDDNLSRPAFNDSPATMIEPFYRKYAARKPICLVECGVTRRSRVENADADQYAAARMSDLMNAVRVRFPRLKMMCFFDRDNLTGAIPGRRLNDYSLPDGSLVLSALKAAAADPYFLAEFAPAAAAPIAYQQISSSLPRGYSGPLMASIVTYDLYPSLRLTQRGKSVTIHRPYIFNLAAKSGPLTVSVVDSHDRVCLAKTVFAQ